MNVLILTPDRVGSTLLQRTLTVYMLRREFDKPVINLHELTNGLDEHYNDVLNRVVLGKPTNVDDWNYNQSLLDIVELLDSADHYKTSRLAHYHLQRRQDSIADQNHFYNYLNNNFFIIKAERDNLFEYAISWIIFAHSKKLNVYSHEDKVQAFNKVYKNPITATKLELESKLNDYKQYSEWASRYFNIQSVFKYEDSINNLEEYILNLPFMKESGTTDNSWEDMFGIDFDTWNKMHKTIPDLFLKEQEGDIKFTPCLHVDDWKNIRIPSWPELPPPNIEDLPVEVRSEVNKHLTLPSFSVTKEQALFLKKNIPAYRSTTDQLDQLINNGFMYTGIPIKLQTFEEKKHLIENFEECIRWFNEWVDENNFGKPFSYTDSQDKEELKFNDFSNMLEYAPDQDI